MRPPWLQTLCLVAAAFCLLMAGTGIQHLVRSLDERYGDASVAWTRSRPRGVRIRVARRPKARKGRSRWACFFTRQHPNAVRHPLGGFRCPDCGVAGADLEAMGFKDGGYVNRRSLW